MRARAEGSPGSAPQARTAPRGREHPATDGGPDAVRISAPLAPGTPGEVLDLKRSLAARAGELRRSPAERAEVLAEVSRRWTDRGDAFRGAGLRSLVEEGDFAPATAAAGLDATFRPWTAPAWRELIRRELGEGAPPLAEAVPHVLGSALPSPNALPLFLTLLAGGAPVARVGRHLPSFPSIALASVAAVDPELAACGCACRWDRARENLTRALFEEARVGSVTGGDEAVEAVSSLAGPGTRLLAHPHRVSFAWVGASALASPRGTRGAAARLARDVALHDQLGCLSPIGVLVAGAGSVEVGHLAHALARALERRERAWPRSKPGPRETAAIRSFHDVFALPGPGAGRRQVLAGPRLAWVVGVLAPGELPPPSPAWRCVWLRPVRGAGDALAALGPWRGATAAVGFRGSRPERGVARAVARELGANRLSTLGRMQSPPLDWRRDGLRPLRDLLP